MKTRIELQRTTFSFTVGDETITVIWDNRGRGKVKDRVYARTYYVKCMGNVFTTSLPVQYY